MGNFIYNDTDDGRNPCRCKKVFGFQTGSIKVKARPPMGRKKEH